MAKILALTSRLPYPPREGHQLRSWHMLRALAKRHEVTLLSFVRDDDAPDATGPLRSAVAQLEMFPIPSEQSRASLGSALMRGFDTEGARLEDFQLFYFPDVLDFPTWDAHHKHEGLLA